MARKSGLGKGLSALIPGETPPPLAEGTTYVVTSKIIPNPRQPRHRVIDEELQELAASIREHGILQPLLVTHEVETDQYILIAGERRLRAATLAGLEAVPVLIRQATEQQRLELALIENVQRADLTPLETAYAYQQLNEEFNLTHDDIALRVGKKRSTVTNTLGLLKSSHVIRQALAEGLISEGHARALGGLDSHPNQATALETVIKEKLNVRKTEELVRKLKGEKTLPKIQETPPPEIRDVVEKLERHLSTRVTIRHGKRGNNTITIYYRSDEDLNALLDRLIRS